MPHVVTFGEIMMKLSPPGKKKMVQTDRLEVLYSGAEANVSGALAQWGIAAAHVTRFPDNPLGQSALNAWRGIGVDMRYSLLAPGRMGLYFVEQGAMNRATVITYDRLPSAFSTIDSKSFNWQDILKDAKWFHWTGITPALSQGAADSLYEALKVCREKKIKVSADINYRSNLWQYGKAPGEVMEPLVAMSQVIVAAASDTRKIFGIHGDDGRDGYAQLAEKMKARFPAMEYMVSSRRDSISASHNRLQGVLWSPAGLQESRVFDMDHIVERIGSGDAFMAGFIYAALQGWSDQSRIDFATASAVMKHAVDGDISLVTLEEIDEFLKGDTGGRVKR